MINTTLLIKQTAHDNKTFTNAPAYQYSIKRLSRLDRVKINQSIVIKTINPNFFSITDGVVDLYEPNQIFYLEHIPGNVDIVLPKVKNMLDWIVLFYDQDRIIDKVSYERHSRIKIYGNGSRIMGLDEPLLCDVPFMSLRFTFVNDIDGWILT